MSEYNTQSTTYTAGYVTAYGAAKRGGYTGSYADFCAATAGLAEVVEDLKDFDVVINTLEPGQAATASYADGVLTLGVPQGIKGDKGDKGETGDVSKEQLDAVIEDLGHFDSFKQMVPGFLPASGSDWPINSSAYPNAAYVAVDLSEGQSLTISGFTSADSNGRARYMVDGAILGSVTTGENSYYTSTVNLSGSVNNGVITAKQDIQIGLLFLTGVVPDGALAVADGHDSVVDILSAVGRQTDKNTESIGVLQAKSGVVGISWEQGALGTSDGAEFMSVKWIRSAKIDCTDGKDLIIKNPNGICMTLYFFSASDALVQTQAEHISAESRVVIPANAAYVRVCLRKADSSVIVPADGSNIEIWDAPKAKGPYQFISNPLVIGSSKDYSTIFANGATLTESDGTVTATVGASRTFIQIAAYLMNRLNSKLSGHKVYIRLDGLDTSHLQNFSHVEIGIYDNVNSSGIVKATGTEAIFDLTESCNVVAFYIYGTGTITEGDYVTLTGVQVVDLTEMFEAGYEPTIEEYKAAYGTESYDKNVNYDTPLTGETKVAMAELKSAMSDIPPEHIRRTTKVATFKDYMLNGETYGTDGGISTSANWKRSPLIPVNEGDVITIEAGLYCYAVYFDKNRSFVQAFVQGVDDPDRGTPQTYVLTIPSGVEYIGINMAKAYEAQFDCLINGRRLWEEYRPEWLRTNSIWKNKTYISHGDSITARDGHEWPSGWPHAGEICRGFQTIFSEKVGLKWYVNEGQGGWPMAVYPERGGIVQKITAITDYKPYDLCTVACGTNDFKLNIPLGTKGIIGDTTFDNTTFYGAYREGIEHMLASNPKLRIVLMTPIQRDNSGYDVNYTNSAGHKLIDYVNAVKELGEMYSLPVCDMYANSGITKLTLSTYTGDGLHPNFDGYVRMGNYLTQFLESVGL